MRNNVFLVSSLFSSYLLKFLVGSRTRGILIIAIAKSVVHVPIKWLGSL